MAIQIVGFAGNPHRPSKTRALVEVAAMRTAERYGGKVKIFDLLDLQPHLGAAAALADLPPPAREVVDAIVAADVLIVGSPVYKGSYSGLFKHLFDLIEPADLAGKPVLLTATGGGEKHALVIEHQLRPLFAFFEAAVLPTGLYAGPSDFIDGMPQSLPLLARLDRGIAQLGPALSPAPGRPQDDRAA
ncbi:MAG: FMN reductase [Paracoccus sp. (in: a-proteobacteria)]|uniref:FMN reductase n=1 Tax=Paracoccus sp. TaxID=267 RepID=UPI0039E4B3C8